MAKHIISGERDTTWALESSDDIFTVAEKGTIQVTNTVGIDIEIGFTGNTLNILGTVRAGGDGGRGINIDAADTTVKIGEQGSLIANEGLNSSATNTHVINSGNIQGRANGVELGDEAGLINRGEISGEVALTMVSGALANAKGAHIVGDEEGMAFTGDGSEKIVNHGLISGGLVAIDLGNMGGQIINDGRIEGVVILGGDDSLLDTRGGIIDGTVKGGDRSDTYIVSSTKLDIVESISGGFDVLKSTVSISLPKNVEQLQLIGKHDIDGEGTAGDNQLFGNSGENQLTGSGGSDFLDGGAGNDVLRGGAGADNFDFTKGGGTDTVRDYHDGEDLIGVLGFSQFRSYADLSHHIHQHNDDVWITLGHGDKIIVDHADAAAFDPKDFVFALT
jgi:Ca2+-binding RTX toxin-like protein